MDVIIQSCLDKIYTMLAKGVPVVIYITMTP